MVREDIIILILSRNSRQSHILMYRVLHIFWSDLLRIMLWLSLQRGTPFFQGYDRHKGETRCNNALSQVWQSFLWIEDPLQCSKNEKIHWFRATHAWKLIIDLRLSEDEDPRLNFVDEPVYTYFHWEIWAIKWQVTKETTSPSSSKEDDWYTGVHFNFVIIFCLM